VPLFLQSALGVSIFIGLAWAVSEDRRAFPWRIVVAGLAFQFALAAVLLKLPWVRDWVAGLNEVMQALERATEAGTQTAHSSMDAITSGTIAGVALLINIIALLLVFVAPVSLADTILGLLPHFARLSRFWGYRGPK